MPSGKIFLLLSSIVALLLLAFLAGAANPVRGENGSHVIRLENVSLSAVTELGLHPRLVLDYGTFLWLEVSDADLARLQSSGLAYQEQVDPYLLRLGERNIDLSAAAPQQIGPEPDLFLVQFAGPTRAEWLASLRASGLRIVQYIHPFTYVVWGETNALQTAGTLSFVRWMGSFIPEYRLLPAWRGLPDIAIQVDVMLYRGADVTAAIQQIETLGGQSLGRVAIDATFEIAQFTLSGARLQDASHITGVYSIQPVPTDGGLRGEMSDQINAGNYDATNLAFPGYPACLGSAGVHGTGVIIANVDGGVDNNHVDLVNRFVSCVGQTCGGSASSSHGTHTAGIMAADGSSGVRDSYGFLRGLGMAPGANLVEQVYSPWYTQPDGMLLLITESYRNGASLSGNSWGPSSSPVGYDLDTRQVDVGVRDADPGVAGNQSFSYVLSIMNGGGGYQTQGSPDEGKNIFTIGSTWMQDSGGQMLNIDDLSANTAHGPALDGRKIPHMVAPGCDVDSTVPNGYDLMCGTSMASPHVSGAVALFIEYYRNLFGVDPSPALIKAAYLPVAHDLAGHLDADGVVLGHPFDAKQGWGRMNTAAVISPSLEVHYYDNPVVFDNTGEEWTQALLVSDPAQPLKIMLVWTDAPGHGLGGSTPAWNNDLDLMVTAGGHTYRGNVFDSQGWSLPDASTPDGMNNTEGVFLGPAASGSVTVQVIASNISSDGIPGLGDDTDQDFALVCYNCASQPDFDLTVQPKIQALCAPVQAVYTATVDALVGFAQPVTLSVLGAPSESAVFFNPNPVLPTGDSLLTIDTPVTVTAGSYAVELIGTTITRAHTVTLGLDLYTILPGVPELLFPSAETNNVPVRPTFTWQVTAQARTYGIQIATDVAFTHVVVAAAGLVVPSYTPAADLEHDTIYFWRAQSFNPCGESVYSAANRFLTEPAIGTCSLGTVPVTLLSEDFETDAPQWTHGGTGGDWAQDSVRKHSGTYSYKAKDEPEVSNQWLVSPVLQLPYGQGPLTLSFWNYQNVENRPEGCVDGGILEVSTDGGVTWVQIESQLFTDPYDGPVATGSGNPLAGLNAWCGKPQNWLASLADLDEFAGQALSIRFRLGTDNNLIGYEGWYVDDVSVQSCVPVAVLEAGEPLEAFPGRTVTHTLTLTNGGPSDSFILSLSGNAWDAQIVSANPVTVTSGATTTILVQVQVPEDAQVNSDTFTLTASSVNVPGVKLTAQGITIRLPWMNVYLPLMRK
jgi:serine protease AprX